MNYLETQKKNMDTRKKNRKEIKKKMYHIKKKEWEDQRNQVNLESVKEPKLKEERDRKIQRIPKKNTMKIIT